MSHPKDDLTGLDPLTGSNFSNNDSHAFNDTNPDVLDDQIIAHALDLNAWVETKRKPSRSEVGLDTSTPKVSFAQLFSPLHPLTKQIKKVHRKVTAQPSIEILSVANLCQNDAKNFQWGWVGQPNKGDEIQGEQLLIDGWIIGRNAQPLKIQFVVSQTIIAETPVHIPRPDVIKVHFYAPELCNCGYSFALSTKMLPHEADLYLQAVFPDQQVANVAAIHFCRYG